MEAKNLEQLFSNSNTIQMHQIVYEANDEGMMLYFTVCKNNKEYHSKMVIDWSGLNWIIGKYAQIGIDIYDAISERLFQNSGRFKEYHFTPNLTLVNEYAQAA